MTIRIFATLALTAGLAMAALPASAGFISGSITMSGDFLPSNGSSLGDATGIDFKDDDFGVDGATEDFAGAGIVAGSVGTINDFEFAPFVVAPFELWEIGGFTFNLHRVSVPYQTDAFLILTGFGTVTGNGFDETNGSWSLSANRNGSLFNFSSGTVVPEPNSLALFSLGLLGLGVVRRRFRG